jgi:MoxR-like ATPase
VAGRGYVTPDDVKAMAPDVLRHRILLSYEAEADGVTADNAIAKVLEQVRTP